MNHNPTLSIQQCSLIRAFLFSQDGALACLQAFRKFVKAFESGSSHALSTTKGEAPHPIRYILLRSLLNFPNHKYTLSCFLGYPEEREAKTRTLLELYLLQKGYSCARSRALRFKKQWDVQDENWEEILTGLAEQGIREAIRTLRLWYLPTSTKRKNIVRLYIRHFREDSLYTILYDFRSKFRDQYQKITTIFQQELGVRFYEQIFSWFEDEPTLLKHLGIHEDWREETEAEREEAASEGDYTDQDLLYIFCMEVQTFLEALAVPELKPLLHAHLQKPSLPHPWRRSCAYLLGCFQVKSAIPDLIKVISEPLEEPELCTTAIKALGMLQATEAQDKLIEWISPEHIIEQTYSREAWDASWTTTALCKIGPTKTITAHFLTCLYEAFITQPQSIHCRETSMSYRLITKIISALADWGESALLPCLETLFNTSNPLLFGQVAVAMHRLGVQDIHQDIWRRLHLSNTPTHKGQLALQLVQIGDLEALPQVFQTFQHSRNSSPSLEYEQDVFDTLAPGLHESITPKILELLIKREKQTSRTTVIDWCRKYRIYEALPILLEHLRQQNTWQKQRALLFAIGELGQSNTAFRILPFCEHIDEDIREAAIIALGQVAGSRYEDLFQEVANEDPSPEVQKAAEQCLRALRLPKVAQQIAEQYEEALFDDVS